MRCRGHGTAVAGVLSAISGNALGISGCSYNAKILPVKVLDDTGHGDLSYVVSAFDYVLGLGHEVSVINMSLESSIESISLQSQINTASVTYGITCVAAAAVEYSASSSGSSTFPDTGGSA